MTEMIEKVARAIWESEPTYSVVKFEHVTGHLAEQVRSVARAAITAYESARTPDPAIVKLMREALERLVEAADSAAWSINTSMMDGAIGQARSPLPLTAG